MIFKCKKQDFNSIKDSLPDLYTVINSNLKHLSDEDKGVVAGVIIEYVIQTGGDVDIFQEEIDLNEDDWDETDTL